MSTVANIARRTKLVTREIKTFKAYRTHFSMALYNEWERAYDLLVAHEQGRGAHADTTREVDAGTPEGEEQREWGWHNHRSGRVCMRLCNNKTWAWDGINRVKS